MLLSLVAVACAGPPDEQTVTAEAGAALDRAEIEAARGNPAAAEALYLEVLALRPDDAGALSGLARVRLAQGDFEDAIDLDDRSRASGQTAPRSLATRERCALWRSAADARIDAGRADADVLLDRIEADPICPSAGWAPLRARSQALRADAALAAGDLEAAISAWRTAVVFDPTRLDLRLRLARTLLDEGRRLEAVDELARGLAIDPDDEALTGVMLEALGVPATAARAAE